LTEISAEETDLMFYITS